MKANLRDILQPGPINPKSLPVLTEREREFLLRNIREKIAAISPVGLDLPAGEKSAVGALTAWRASREIDDETYMRAIKLVVLYQEEAKLMRNGFIEYEST